MLKKIIQKLLVTPSYTEHNSLEIENFQFFLLKLSQKSTQFLLKMRKKKGFFKTFVTH